MALFNIEIKSITKCLTPTIEDYLYVDDFCITSRLKYMRTAECQLQQCIQKITQLANKWFQNLQRQNVMRAFLSIEKIYNEPLIKFENTEKRVTDKYIFLGVIFDRKLIFIPHIKYLKTKSI